MAGLFGSAAAMGILFLPTSIILAIGMLPTFIAMLVEDDADHTAPITVGAMNFAGVMPFIILLWQRGQTLNNALNLMTEPVNWLVMYGAALGGWIVYFVLPSFVAVWATLRAEFKIRELKALQEKLQKEWGPDVTGARQAGETQK